MTFEPTHIDGAWFVRTQRQSDERGWFARTFCEQEFKQQGLVLPTAQCSLSFNHDQATLRGLHWQHPPHGEVKLVRCLRGGIWDVLADVRPDSPTSGQWQGLELSEQNCLCLYIPEGVAHGFVTLESSSLIHYQISTTYHPEASAGLRWDDPAFAIDWPLQPRNMSERDRQWPDWRPLELSNSLTEGGIHASRC